MDDLVYICILTLIFSIVIFVIGSLFRLKFNLRSKPLRIHHAYVGIVLILIVLLIKQISLLSKELISLGLALIISDLFHHIIYKTK